MFAGLCMLQQRTLNRYQQNMTPVDLDYFYSADEIQKIWMKYLTH